MLQIESVTTFMPAAARLVAIGDLHGDMSKTRRAFKIGGLIDNQDRWTGGTTTAVQVTISARINMSWLPYSNTMVLTPTVITTNCSFHIISFACYSRCLFERRDIAFIAV